MRLSLVLPTLLAATGIFASAVAAAESAKTPTTTTGLRASTTHQDARRTNRYWIAPVRNSGLTCIDNSIRAGGGKPDEICMTEGEALCIEYDYKPMGGRWQFGIKDSKLRLYNPKGEVVYEYCKDVTHLCIGEEHGFDPNRYSKERPYLTLYDEKIHEVVGSLTCDGTDGKNDENIGQSSILKLVDQADVGPYADYPLTLVKFKKGQTEDPNDENSLLDITVTEPVATAIGLQLESFLNYNADRCEWNSYVDSFEDLKRQIAAATDSNPDNRAKIEVCEDRPIVFDSIIDFSDKYFELSCLGDGCVFDLDGYSLVTPDGVDGSPFYAEFEGIAFENGSSDKGRDDDTYNTIYGGAFMLRGASPDASSLVLNDCTLRNNVALSDSGAIDSIGASVVAIDSVFTDNVSGNDGGAAYIDGVSRFENCRFEGNYADNDGGALQLFDASVSIENCRFEDNTANDDGGAVNLEGDTAVATFLGCQFGNNKAEGTASSNHGGAVYVYDADATFVDCRFEMNSAIDDGGAVALFTSSLATTPANATLKNCNFNENSAGDDGGALRLVRSVAELEDCGFDRNVARDEGGGIYASASDLDVKRVNLVGNTADDGGAIYASASDLDLSGGTMVGNKAGFGGAIFAMSTSSAIFNCKFGDNSAIETGGAVIAFDSTTDCRACEFDKNSAGFDGGAIFLEGASSTSTFAGCTFSANEAIYGGAILLHTGALASISACSFSNNFADIGGALFTEEAGTRIADSTTFECNGAAVAGAMLNFYGSIDILDAAFTNNAAYLGGALLIDSANSSISDSRFDQNEALDFPFVPRPPTGGGAIVYSEFGTDNHSVNRTVFQNNTSVYPSDDILDANAILLGLPPTEIECGTDSENCFCDADPVSLPNITTNDLPTTCRGADIGSGPSPCSSCIPTPPSTCPVTSRAGAMSRAGSSSFKNMNMNDLHNMLEDKMNSMGEKMAAMKEKMSTAMKEMTEIEEEEEHGMRKGKVRE